MRSVESWENLMAEIEKLPADERALMKLRYGEDRSCSDAEIRRATGWTQEYVDRVSNSAYERLKPQFPEGFE